MLKFFQNIYKNIFSDSCYKFSVNIIFSLFLIEKIIHACWFREISLVDFAKSVLLISRNQSCGNIEKISIVCEINLLLVYIFDDIAKTTSMKIFKIEL